MKSKYPKEYSNLKKMDINVLKRRNELSSLRSFDSQERCELRLENENQTCCLQMKLCDIWRVLRPGKYDFYVLICVLTMV